MVAQLPTPIQAIPRTDALARARVALLHGGLDACGDEQLLALLLDGRDALPMARRTLDAIGGLRGIAMASATELSPWLDQRRAAALVAAFELGRRAATAWPERTWIVRSPADIAEQLVPAMGQLEHEELRVVLLNTKNAVIDCSTVYVGNLAGSSVRVGELYRAAVRRQAAAIVVAHNHPSGDPTPSAEDLRITRELSEAGRLLDIELLDHLVIGHGRWLSLRSLGAI